MNVLEIGVGGYEDPDKGGASLLMWKYYFPRSAIYAIDVYDKSKLQEKRIKIFQGSQNDEKFLKDVFSRIGSLDIIIDDGSHMNEHVLTSFKTLFPLLKDGGIYAVEDVQTSYWPQYGGSSEDLNNPATAMGFFKKIADGLNYMELAEPGYEPAYFDKNITSIHFYHNLVIIYKGVNDERSIGRPRASGDPIK
jgi:demethylmacrocin O-methyltransferase